VFKVPSGLYHWLSLIVSFEFLADDLVPKTIRIVIIVDWQVRCALLPHQMHLWRHYWFCIFVLSCGLALYLLSFQFF